MGVGVGKAGQGGLGGEGRVFSSPTSHIPKATSVSAQDRTETLEDSRRELRKSFERLSGVVTSGLRRKHWSHYMHLPRLPF